LSKQKHWTLFRIFISFVITSWISLRYNQWLFSFTFTHLSFYTQTYAMVSYTNWNHWTISIGFIYWIYVLSIITGISRRIDD